MKVKVSEASGSVLDWMVAKAEGAEYEDGLLVWYEDEVVRRQLTPAKYSSDWSQGGPIIEREFICIKHGKYLGRPPAAYIHKGDGYAATESGHTPLIAAMRCYVTAKLGEEVEVPDGFAH